MRPPVQRPVPTTSSRRAPARRLATVALAALAVVLSACAAPIAPVPDTDPLSRTEPDWLVRADSMTLRGPAYRTAAGSAAVGDPASMAAIGSSGLPGQGLRPTGTRPATGEYSSAAAVVPPGAWTGLQSIGPFLSTTSDQWPTRSLDFRIRSQLYPSARSGAHGWIEMLLATVDELQDYFEPGYVQLPSGIHFGVDFLHDRVTGMEETWVTTAPLPDPYGLHVYRLTIDGGTGAVALFIDGALFESA